MKNINEVYTHALKKCVEIRETELFISQHYPEQIFRCPVHLAIGHEAIPAALLAIHSKNRYIFSYHRSHHHFIASGATPESLLFELAGSSKGACHGFGGSHHLRDEACGFLGSTPIITGTLPVATGHAHGIKLQKKSDRVFVFMGDTCGEEGLFYECLNMASLYQLPITFVIEDNGLSCFTPAQDRQGFESYQSIARHFALRYYETKGDNLEEVIKVAQMHFDDSTTHQGPALFYASVFRPYEHCGYQIEDNQEHRSIEDSWPKRDPIHNSSIKYRDLIEETRKELHNRFIPVLEEIRESLKGVIS